MDAKLIKIQNKVAFGKSPNTTLNAFGVSRERVRICLPYVGDMILYFLVETHGFGYSINLSLFKMYHGFR